MALQPWSSGRLVMKSMVQKLKWSSGSGMGAKEPGGKEVWSFDRKARQTTCNEAPNILGHAWPPDLPLKGFNGLLHAEVAREGTAVHLFQGAATRGHGWPG